jgi:hypothetical protein
MSMHASTRLQHQLRQQRQMQQAQRNPYAERSKTLPPRQDQPQPDQTSYEAQQRHSANQ